MTFNLKQFYPIIFLQIAHFCLISHSQLQLDNDYYSDKAYDDYVEEYERNLKVSGMDDDYEYHEENEIKVETKDIERPTESYSEAAARLKCDDPWFWNAVKCTWLDAKGKTVGERTKRNATTSAWFLGSIFILLFLWLCGLYCVYCLKYRNRYELMKLRKKYTPGRLQLPNGKVAHFPPSEEENKAYEELVKAIIIQEMM